MSGGENAWKQDGGTSTWKGNKGPTGALMGNAFPSSSPLNTNHTNIPGELGRGLKRPRFAARGCCQASFSFPAAIGRPREATSPPALTQGRCSRPLWAGVGAQRERRLDGSAEQQGLEGPPPAFSAPSPSSSLSL